MRASLFRVSEAGSSLLRMPEAGPSLFRMSEAVGQVLLLMVWMTFLLLPESEGCMDTAWSKGHFSPDIGGVTFASPDGSSCQCCGLCHQNSACASLSYNADTRECQLHSSVAGYDTLTLNDTWKYFVIPGRSQHHQFCREDSDCQTQGDFCRGRVCTDLTAVTCRVIFETFGAGEQYGEYSEMFGWLNNASVKLACMMGIFGYEGYTRILRSPRDFQFDRQSVLEYNTALDPDVYPHSMMALAEHVRQAGTDPTYRITVFRETQDYYVRIHYDVPREEPVLSDKPRPDVGSPETDSNLITFSWRTSLPYLPPSGKALVTTNADSVNDQDGAVAREDGKISWAGNSISKLFIYIRE